MRICENIKPMKYIRDGRAPIPTSEKVSRTMSAIRAKNTKPELLLRKMLLSVGLNKYRLHPKNIPGRPDITFVKKKVAIFVHGCFWHGCPFCKPKLPKTHRVFWRKKIEMNKIRDARKNRELKQGGWRSLTVWTCRLKTERGRSGVIQRINTSLEGVSMEPR